MSFRGNADGQDAQTDAQGECDVSGVFAVRMATNAHFIIDSVTSNWFYVEIAQDGDTLSVQDSVDCGYGSSGGGMHAYTSPQGDNARAMHNSQVGRAGVMRKSGQFCDFSLGRFWSVHGISEDVYLPDGHFATYDLAHIKGVIAIPTEDKPEGAEDWDGDGKPGLTVNIGSSEARYSVGRDWNEWFSCNGTASDSAICSKEDVQKYALKVGTNLDMFTVRADFEGEDYPLGATSNLYDGESMPQRIADNRVTFKRLGRTRADGLAKMFWDQPSATERCAMLRELLPIQDP